MAGAATASPITEEHLCQAHSRRFINAYEKSMSERGGTAAPVPTRALCTGPSLEEEENEPSVGFRSMTKEGGRVSEMGGSTCRKTWLCDNPQLLPSVQRAVTIREPVHPNTQEVGSSGAPRDQEPQSPGRAAGVPKESPNGNALTGWGPLRGYVHCRLSS